MCLELGLKGESKILETTSFKKAEQGQRTYFLMQNGVVPLRYKISLDPNTTPAVLGLSGSYQARAH